MLLITPVFATLLKLLYVRSHVYYVKHLVFSLHYGAFTFLLLTAVLLLANWPNRLLVPIAETALLAWGIAYLFVSLRTVCGESVLRTMAKTGVLALFHLVFLLGSVVATSLLIAARLAP